MALVPESSHGGSPPDLAAVLAEGNDANGAEIADLGRVAVVATNPNTEAVIVTNVASPEWASLYIETSGNQAVLEVYEKYGINYRVRDDNPGDILAIRSNSNTKALGIAGDAVGGVSDITLASGTDIILEAPTVEVSGDAVEIGSGGGANVRLNGDALAFYSGVPVAKQAHIADPSGGAVQDAESRAAIASILNALEAYGLLAVA